AGYFFKKIGDSNFGGLEKYALIYSVGAPVHRIEGRLRSFFKTRPGRRLVWQAFDNLSLVNEGIVEEPIQEIWMRQPLVRIGKPGQVNPMRALVIIIKVLRSNARCTR